MDHALTEEQRIVRDVARDYARREIAPLAGRIDRDGEIPTRLFAGLGELGLMSVNVPSELGGSAAGAVAYSLAMTEISAACASTAVTMAVTNMVGEVISRFGTAEQRERYVRPLASGALGAFGLSEVGAGSDPGGMCTVARRDGEDWIIDGTKQWISHGDRSHVVVVWARTSEGEGSKGLSCFLVEPSMRGFSVTGHEDKMGLRGSPTCALAFERLRVPSDALLGEEGGGFRIAMMALDGGRIGIGSQALGIADAAYGEAIRYANDRIQFGVPIAQHQAVQLMIADMRVELDAARALVLSAAAAKDRGESFSDRASMAKLYASEAAWRVVNRSLQIHGGYGYTREFPVERHFRDVRVTQIYEGTSEIQRVVIARNLLKR